MDAKELLAKVKKMREETGLPVMELKSALEEAEGDETKAKAILKTKAVEKAEKKSEREVKAGRVATYTHSTGRVGVMVELLCETDFVSRNEQFVEVTRDICLQVAAMNPTDAAELLEQDFIKDPSVKIKDLINQLVAKFGENIKLGRICRFEI